MSASFTGADPLHSGNDFRWIHFPFRPALITRLALPFLLILLAGIFAALFTIRYPEIVKSRAVVKGGDTNIILLEVDIGKINLHGIGSGERVLLNFDPYPSQNWGALEGFVQHEKWDELANSLDVQIFLPKGVVTSFNKRIEIRYGQRVDLLVVTREMKLIERILNKR
jgi:hypothetical protein